MKYIVSCQEKHFTVSVPDKKRKKRGKLFFNDYSNDKNKWERITMDDVYFQDY